MANIATAQASATVPAPRPDSTRAPAGPGTPAGRRAGWPSRAAWPPAAGSPAAAFSLTGAWSSAAAGDSDPAATAAGDRVLAPVTYRQAIVAHRSSRAAPSTAAHTKMT